MKSFLTNILATRKTSITALAAISNPKDTYTITYSQRLHRAPDLANDANALVSKHNGEVSVTLVIVAHVNVSVAQSVSSDVMKVKEEEKEYKYKYAAETKRIAVQLLLFPCPCADLPTMRDIHLNLSCSQRWKSDFVANQLGSFFMAYAGLRDERERSFVFVLIVITIVIDHNDMC